MFAIVETNAAEVDGVCAFLERAFGADVVPGTEENYLTLVLAPLDRSGASIVLAVQWDRDVVVGSCHGGQAYLCRQDVQAHRAIESHGASDQEGVRVARVTLSVGHSLVLVSAEVARHVRKHELQETVCTDFSNGYSVNDAAGWLATLGSGRSDRQASALVLYVHARPPAGRTAARSVALPRRLALSQPAAKTIATLLFSMLMLGLVFLVLRPIGTSSKTPLAGSGAPPATIPRPSGADQATAMPRVPAPARPVVWTFPALSHATGRVMLALYNPRAVAVVAEVRIFRAGGDDARRVRIPARATVKLPLSAAEARDGRGNIPALAVSVAAPVVPTRLTVAVDPTATPLPTATALPTASPTVTASPGPTSTLRPTATARPTRGIRQSPVPNVAPQPTGTTGAAKLSLGFRSAVGDAAKASTRISRCQSNLAGLASGSDSLGSIKMLGCINRATHRLQVLINHLGPVVHQSLPPSAVALVSSASKTAAQAQTELKVAAQDIQSASIGEAQSALLAAAKDVRAAQTALAQAQRRFRGM